MKQPGVSVHTEAFYQFAAQSRSLGTGLLCMYAKTLYEPKQIRCHLWAVVQSV